MKFVLCLSLSLPRPPRPPHLLPRISSLLSCLSLFDSVSLSRSHFSPDHGRPDRDSDGRRGRRDRDLDGRRGRHHRHRSTVRTCRWPLPRTGGPPSGPGAASAAAWTRRDRRGRRGRRDRRVASGAGSGFGRGGGLSETAAAARGPPAAFQVCIKWKKAPRVGSPGLPISPAAHSEMTRR